MTTTPKEILCLGPLGSGKTTLLRKLQDPSGPPTVTISTAGSNLLTFHIDKKQAVNINELGGSMVPIWKTYYTDCSAVIFVVDSSCLQQVSSSCVLFLDILNNPLLKNIPILFVLNKTDVKTSTTLFEIKSLLFLDQVTKLAHQKITVVECSCHSGDGLNTIKDWLVNIASS